MSFAMEQALTQLQQLNFTGKFETDSRSVNVGDIFICQQGQQIDSHTFALDAIKQGACGVISSRKLDITVPNIVMPDDSMSLGLIYRYYQFPQDRMLNIGITGTNGKTTVAYGLMQLLGQEYTAAYTGTLGCHFASYKHPTVNTTPGPVELANQMSNMIAAGVTHHVMEVSSHALDQGRADMIDFDIAIFTNLKEDHLDYHGSRSRYIQSKLSLIDRLKPGGMVIINLDDEMACAIKDRCRGRARTITISTRDPGADIYASEIKLSNQHSQFQICSKGQSFPITLQLPFTFNIVNSLAILAALQEITGNLESSAQRLTSLQPVPGRCEPITLPQGGSVLIDYAHNCDGISHLLHNIRPHTKGRILLVAGITGDRLDDAGEFGRLCTETADLCWFTCHNPLGVDLTTILAAMSQSAVSNRFFLEPDRIKAIDRALAELQADDVLVICGKGPETWQYMQADKSQPTPYIGDRAAIQLAQKRFQPDHTPNASSYQCL
ncbi:UDP-N-acetylmuramoyl-L-alanyl-D-glutamate--2,6-diaminopimelate ligase [Sansalvadorimonas sp. 2012CJ34-2]|uniref:UDP-N-acetylmuramoyl-L-alanyl-D-glutamate--2, 6-diaminopimelate ligase n=1 Tax=Parendozoicomonas callyspongiae TaxID=2942213 RepID=A0ABT0PIY8_9GAMM|nr:UDP-N-acetylmuramoyl-L-alanyl-D-glutamate--2,6-diaminopimelate ligase [Sansalvadorimonas sp. 2012CJ34-2]MCL6271323.1 UDP-N-acetylmuramoyl-L-alanyl-D-glutamate--2,6-diaminopimelate ligase [Sansalvadorimonas sp. 2012CJ34-2]